MKQQDDSPFVLEEQKEEQQQSLAFRMVDLPQLLSPSSSTTTTRVTTKHHCHSDSNNTTAVDGHVDYNDKNIITITTTTPTMVAATQEVEEPSASNGPPHILNTNDMTGNDSLDGDKKQEPTKRSRSGSSSSTSIETIDLLDEDVAAAVTNEPPFMTPPPPPFLTPAAEQQPQPNSSTGAGGGGVASMSRIISSFTNTFGTTTPTAATTTSAIMFTTNPTANSDSSSSLYPMSYSSSSSKKENEEQVLTSPTESDFFDTQQSSVNKVPGMVDSAPVILMNQAYSDSSNTVYPKSHTNKGEDQDMMMSPMTDMTFEWNGFLLSPKQMSPMNMYKKKKGPGEVSNQPKNQVQVLPNEIVILNKKEYTDKLFFLERKVEHLDKKVTLLHTTITEIQTNVVQSLLTMKIKMAPVLEDTTNRDLVLEKRLEGLALALEQALNLTKERFDRLEKQKQTIHATVAVIIVIFLVGILFTKTS